MKSLKIAAVLVVSGIGLWLLLCGAIGVMAIEGALHPARLLLQPADEVHALVIAEHNHAQLSNVSITTDDGVTLRGWTMRPRAANGDAVILLHGQADNRAGMLGNADLLLQHGYSVLLPDARAHGASEGAFATYGVKEANDLRGWFELIERSQSPQCIDGLGDSMGGAELLRSLAAESGYCAVVAESSFASFREAGYDRLGQQFHAGSWLGRTLLRPAVTAGLLYGQWKYGIDLAQASPQVAVAMSRVPVFLIHGLMDTNLPPRHAKIIKMGNESVVLWQPANAGHCEAAGADPEEYGQRVVSWFDQHHRTH